MVAKKSIKKCRLQLQVFSIDMEKKKEQTKKRER